MSHDTSLENEQWRDIPNYEGYYQVSDHGRVRSLDRTVINRNGVFQQIRGKVLAPGLHTAGYPQVVLHKNGKGKIRTIHTLVMEVFVGPRPKGMEVRHLDDDPTNNHISNLTYGTPTQNRLDSVRNGTHFEARQTHCQRGHAFTESNIIIQSNGRDRKCRTCNEERNRKYYLERKKKRAELNNSFNPNKG